MKRLNTTGKMSSKEGETEREIVGKRVGKKMNDEEYASNFWNREVLRKYFWEYDPQVQHFVCVRVIELPYEK